MSTPATAPATQRFTVDSTSSLPFSAADELCKSRGRTLPIINTADDASQLLIFFNAVNELNSKDGSVVLAYLNAQRVGGCNRNLGDPDCRFDMLQEGGRAVTIFSGGDVSGTPAIGRYTNWVEDYPQPGLFQSSIAIRRNGRWVNRSPSLDAPPYTICEAVRAATPTALKWWYIVVPVACVLFIAVAAVVTWRLVVARSRARRAATLAHCDRSVSSYSYTSSADTSDVDSSGSSDESDSRAETDHHKSGNTMPAPVVTSLAMQPPRSHSQPRSVSARGATPASGRGDSPRRRSRGASGKSGRTPRDAPTPSRGGRRQHP